MAVHGLALQKTSAYIQRLRMAERVMRWVPSQDASQTGPPMHRYGPGAFVRSGGAQGPRDLEENHATLASSFDELDLRGW